MPNIELIARVHRFVVLTGLVIYIRATTQPTCEIRHDPHRGLTADCSNRRLSSVPHDLPHNIVMLDLHRNNIQNLHNPAFSKFKMLTSLDLSENSIGSLERDVFKGLGTLLDLSLRFNRLHFDNGTYALDIFGSLVNLKRLVLLNNLSPRQGYAFPDYIFRPLHQLRHLEMELWPPEGPTLGLTNLTSLQYLYVDSIHQHVFLNTTFSCLQSSPITSFSTKAKLYNVEKCVFCQMNQLTDLNIKTYYSSYITLQGVNKLFYPFRGFNMTFVDLSGAQINSQHRRSVTLSKSVFGYLSNVCIKRLDLSNNGIIGLSTGLIQHEDVLWSCLTHLDLSRNPVSPIPFQLLIQIGVFMMNLEVLDISYTYYIVKDPIEISLNTTLGFPSYNRHRPPGNEVVISFPPKLRLFNFSRYCVHLSGIEAIHLKNGEHMRVLDMSNNAYLSEQFTITGLSGITFLDISGMIVEEGFFHNTDMFQNVETLIATDIVPIPDFLEVNSMFFTQISKAIVLDLSGCNLQIADTGSFTKLFQLEKLIVARNRFSTIPQEFLHMSSLHALDLSGNIISVLTPLERGQLDIIRQQRKHFSLNLKGNPFICTCATLEFIQWLQETEVSLDNKGNYSCLSENGSRTDTGRVYQAMLLHWRHCIGQFWFYIASILTTIMAICTMSAFLLQKFYPKLEFHLLHMLGYNTKKLKTRADCKFDAYLYYGEDVDPMLCQNTVDRLMGINDSLRLFTNTNILAGRFIVHDFHDNISKCWKLVVVVTEALFDDNSVMYTVLMAATQFSTDGVLSSRILLVYEDDSPAARAQTPRILLNVVPEENIIVMRDDDKFWRQLLRMIQTDQCGPVIVF